MLQWVSCCSLTTDPLPLLLVLSIFSLSLLISPSLPPFPPPARIDDPSEVDPSFDPLVVASLLAEKGMEEEGRKILGIYLPRVGGNKGGKARRREQRIGMTVGEYMAKVTAEEEIGGE